MRRPSRLARGSLLGACLATYLWPLRASADPILADPTAGTLTLVVRDTKLTAVDGLAFDSFGNLFANLELTSSSGGVAYVNKNSGFVTQLVSGINSADQIAFDPTGVGRFFITSETKLSTTTGRIWRMDVTYNSSRIPTSASAMSIPPTSRELTNTEGLVVLEAPSAYGNVGDLMVGEDAVNGRIVRIDPANGTTTVLVDFAAMLNRPEGFAFGNFGGALTPSLYVAETTDDNVLRIFPDGSVSVFGPTFGLSRPDNLEFGPGNFLYVAEDEGVFGGRVMRIAADGTLSTLATGFKDPAGLAVDPDTGYLYISDQGDGSIWRFAASQSAVPEPASAMLLSIACVVLLMARWARASHFIGPTFVPNTGPVPNSPAPDSPALS